MDSVLLAIDDPDLRKTFHLILAEGGYSVTEASTGERALSALAGSPAPLIVLLDTALAGKTTAARLLQLIATERRIGRHRYIVCTTLPTDFLPSKLIAQIVRARLPILQMPFELETLYAIMAPAQAQSSLAPAISEPRHKAPLVPAILTARNWVRRPLECMNWVSVACLTMAAIAGAIFVSLVHGFGRALLQ
jgi:CheY-like chemotaxis protein